ncbi:MAG: hypothetical protein JNM30_21470 [Rhodospirillales bacterium]|nr:hypothetical protein [Rhodospirillales bacterium]
MLSHVGSSLAPSAASLAAAVFPMSSDTDYVSPYLRRPLRPLDEVERARKARDSRRPAPQGDQDEGKSERRDR